MFDVTQISKEWFETQNCCQLHYYDSTDSTNTQAKNHLPEDPSKSGIFLAAKQEAGRGRGSNSWLSPSTGNGFLCSFALKASEAPQPICTPLFGWAIYKAFKEVFDLDFKIKAPNDIYIDGKKIAGILLESISKNQDHYLILGLGINVFSHPQIENSAALSDFSPNAIEENQWREFLSHLKTYISQAVAVAGKNTLSSPILKELESALVAPQLGNLKALEPDGSLILDNGNRIDWREI